MTTTIRSSADGSKSYIAVSGTDVVTVGTQGIEAGSFKPGAITANDFADGALIENAPVGIGYGSGAGGTVTQATSKATAVTLNKPCGKITMHNASLAADALVVFVCLNSVVKEGDIVVASIVQSSASAYAYQLTTYTSNSGVYFQLRNITGAPLADALKINFAVIKGAIS